MTKSTTNKKKKKNKKKIEKKIYSQKHNTKNQNGILKNLQANQSKKKTEGTKRKHKIKWQT